MNRLVVAASLLIVLAATARAQDPLDGRGSGPRRPLIGVEANIERDPVTGERVARVADAYLEAVRHAGGEPVIISPLSTTVDAILARVDGVVLTGGDDVPPKLYGEEAHTDEPLVDRKRLAFGKELIAKALERGVPILGICYGHQLLNVLLGGKLVQDIPTLVKDAERHRSAAEHEKGETRHELRVLPGSRLAETTGAELEVNSFHHQAVRIVGRGLRAVAKAKDGIIEAVESLDPRRFVLGVQWHPERLDRDHPGRRVFEKLVGAAEDYRKTRTDALLLDVKTVRDRAKAEVATDSPPKDGPIAREGVERPASEGFTRILDRVETRQRAARR